MKGETTALKNLQLTLSDDGESTVVTFSFLPLAAETDAEYSVKFKTDDAVTLSFTTPASDWWNGYAAESYDGGSGSATDPYRIATKEQLALFDLSTDKYDNKYFVLTTDLDMSGKYWKAKSFNGHLDGKGHTIRNLTIKGSDVANYAGFISQTTAPVVTYLQNINFESPVLDCTANYAGILAGYTMDTCIENCHVYNGKISSATNVGGLVGMLGSQKAKSGTAYVERCSFSGDMEGTTAAGLISSVYFSNATRAGYVEINDCYAAGNVTATESGSGLIKAISYMQGVTVEHCYSAATVVSGTLDDCGGLVSGVSYSSAKAIADKGLVLKNNVAANPSISDNGVNNTSTKSGRVVAQATSIIENNKGIFTNNYGLASMKVNGSFVQEGDGHGTNVTAEQLADAAFWTDTVGFDLSAKGTWVWDDAAKLPVLNTEKLAKVEIAFTAQPQNATVFNNKNAVFGVAVKGGTMGYTYLWQYSADGKTWQDVADSDNDAIAVAKNSLYSTNQMKFRRIVTDSTGNQAISDNAVLTVVNAKYTSDQAVSALAAYYNAKENLTFAGEAFAAGAVGVDVSAKTLDVATYYGYFAQKISTSKLDREAQLYLDAFALGTDLNEYSVTGKGLPYQEDMIEYLLNCQQDNGRCCITGSGYYSYGTDPMSFAVLDMYFAGGSQWGNETEGTQKGRDGAIRYLLSCLADASGSGKYYNESGLTEDSSAYYDQCAQAEYVLALSRVADDPVYGEEVKDAIAGVLQTLENTYDSDQVLYTRTAAYYVSAFIAGADVTDSKVKANHYLALAEDIVENDPLTAVCADGSYSEMVHAAGMSGDSEATVAVMMALGDFSREQAIVTTYRYDIPENNAAVKDLEKISLPNPVLGDLSLVTSGRLGSVITWESDNKNAIDPVTGKVNRSGKDVVVTLTATAVKGNASAERIFNLTVKADADADTDAVDGVLAALDIPSEVISDITIPGSSDASVALTWETSNAAALAADGTVVRPEKGAADAEAVLTATAAKGNVVKTKTFHVKIIAQTEDVLSEAYYQTRTHWLATKELNGYWEIWSAYAVLGDAIADPANGYSFTLPRPESTWIGTQKGSMVLAIAMMGENPYNYNGKNWVEFLHEDYGGTYASPLFSQLSMEAVGADPKVYTKYAPTSGSAIALSKDLSQGIDVAGWNGVLLSEYADEAAADLAAKDYIAYMKGLNISGDGNFTDGNYISTACAVMGLSALYGAGYDCDPTSDQWVNKVTGKSIIDVVYNNSFGEKETIPGYAAQSQVALCDLYNIKYNHGKPTWLSFRINKEKLDAQMKKANAILAEASNYEEDSVKAVKDALKAAEGISDARLNTEPADYGEEYYALYDAVRHAKVLGQGALDQEAADKVTALINALKDEITLADKDAVAAARAAYNRLTADQKGLVAEDAVAKLNAAETALVHMEAAAAVTDIIQNLNDTITLGDQSAVAAARAAYDKLTAEQKALVTNLDKLTNAENTIKELLAKDNGKVKDMVDVAPGTWYYDDVAYVLDNNIFKGTGATTFGPDQPMTRAMFVTVLGRNAGVEDSTPSYPASYTFDDVNSNEYYAAHVKWAVEKGITVGVSKTEFAPNARISRQDMATMMLRYAKAMNISLPEMDGTPFGDDGEIAVYAREGIYKLKAAGILKGKDDTNFDPKGSTTRVQVAAVLHRFLTYDGSDNGKIDDTDAVIVDIEKFTLGQGFVMEPTVVKLQSGDTAATVLQRVAAEKGLELDCQATGNGFYLAGIRDHETGDATIPGYIRNAIEENGGVLGGRAEGDWLRQFDYTSYSGWMIWVNHFEIEVSAGDYAVKSGDVIRWQFSVFGQGRDFGPDKLGAPYVSVANKDALVKAMAVAGKAQKAGQAYADAVAMMEKMDATQSEVDAAVKALNH